MHPWQACSHARMSSQYADRKACCSEGAWQTRNVCKFLHLGCEFLHLGCKFSVKHCRVGVGVISEQLCGKGLGQSQGEGQVVRDTT